jgi:hypothetical protein
VEKEEEEEEELPWSSSISNSVSIHGDAGA